MIQASTRPVPRSTEDYWEKFDRFQQASSSREPAWLVAQRQAGLARFAELGFPTTEDEDWRFTNVAPITRLPLNPRGSPSGSPAPSVALQTTFGSLRGTKLVFVDGYFNQELSRVGPGEKGIEILNLAAALAASPGIVERHLGRYRQDEQNAFAALNTAFFTDGAFIFLPRGTVVRDPIHVLHLSTGGPGDVTAQIRHLVVAEAGSEATILEHYASLTEQAHVTNVVTEMVLEPGAKVEHCKFQEENSNSFHMASLHAELGRSSNFIAHSFVSGARLSRNNIRTVLAGEGIECVLNGLYITKDEQLADHHMIVEHAQPHCNSHEYFNGILDGKSRGVFHGRILVRQIAQKTDAKQTNKNLLLSDDAGVNTKPQLEIYADDVKCTHGATIGQLNEESIFYLRARGIGKERARRMLMHAFAGEIIDRIRSEPIRETLDRLVWDRLEQNQQIAVTK